MEEEEVHLSWGDDEVDDDGMVIDQAFRAPTPEDHRFYDKTCDDYSDDGQYDDPRDDSYDPQPPQVSFTFGMIGSLIIELQDLDVNRSVRSYIVCKCRSSNTPNTNSLSADCSSCDKCNKNDKKTSV